MRFLRFVEERGQPSSEFDNLVPTAMRELVKLLNNAPKATTRYYADILAKAENILPYIKVVYCRAARSEGERREETRREESVGECAREREKRERVRV